MSNLIRCSKPLVLTLFPINNRTFVVIPESAWLENGDTLSIKSPVLCYGFITLDEFGQMTCLNFSHEADLQKESLIKEAREYSSYK